MTTLSILSVVLLNIALARGERALLQDTDITAGPTYQETSSVTEHAEEQSLGHGYARRGNFIFLNGQRIDQAGKSTLRDFVRIMERPLQLADDVDAASFVVLSEEYAKDKNNIYYKWVSAAHFWIVEIPDADPASFEVMDFNLAKDANHVWRTDVPIKGADPATALVVNPGFVWKDKRSVYYQYTRLAGADPRSFRHLNQAFYADAKHVYWSSTRLKDADVKTFRTFGNDIPFAADARHVWSGDIRLANVDAGSFRVLHNHVFADKKGAYVSTRAFPILGADAATFTKVADLAAADSALFRDAARLYLFDPYYIEVYTLTPTTDGFIVTKPVWFGGAVGPVRHAATVAAIWKNGTLTEPEVEMQPTFEGKPQPSHEVEKLRRMTDAISEAMALDGRKPATRTGEKGKSLQPGGDK